MCVIVFHLICGLNVVVCSYLVLLCVISTDVALISMISSYLNMNGVIQVLYLTVMSS